MNPAGAHRILAARNGREAPAATKAWERGAGRQSRASHLIGCPIADSDPVEDRTDGISLTTGTVALRP
jgi:hypothetical protein